MTPPDHQQKRQTPRRHGTLNPHPETVAHPRFHHSEFFDPDDLAQVKYEMLRQVRVDDGSISESAQAFGSAPAFRLILQRENTASVNAADFETM